MSKLEELLPSASVQGILPNCLVTVVSTQWFGSEALELTYKDPGGKVANELLYRHDEPRIEVAAQGRPWSFDGDGYLFRLVSEAHRIRLAHLFDPVLAVHTSVVEPLPHQIMAVYESMLPRQPLRFLLADDPGAGKTIMAGLLIKELIARGDLQRCLVVCPGSLAEQWQDELYRRFHLPFEILTNDKLEAARTGNWFMENNLVIARLDKLSRNEDVQAKLTVPDGRWDLVVCDEAHKMSATYFGGEVNYTKRYRLGQLLSTITRHFLLMTATPHNGKEADFQLFMALLDGDRFEGRFRDGVHTADVSDRNVGRAAVRARPWRVQRGCGGQNAPRRDQERRFCKIRGCEKISQSRADFHRRPGVAVGGKPVHAGAAPETHDAAARAYCGGLSAAAPGQQDAAGLQARE
jgi:hypothetical protein